MKYLNKFKSIYEYVSRMGLEWFLFRVGFKLRQKTGYFERMNQKILQKVAKADDKLFTYKNFGFINKDFHGESGFIERAESAIDGKIFSFSHEYLDYSFNGKIDWHRNPVTKVCADSKIAWNKLPDFGAYGDIKLIWEGSRFPQVYSFINAYSVSKNPKYAQACLSQIADWIDDNPYPQGVNYKCGQEMSFRLFAWIISMEYFGGYLGKEIEAKIVRNIYTSLLRIDANIDYAAKSVRNNHSVSEAAGLLIGGLLFSQFNESAGLVQKGLEYLINETAYQVYDDGSYIQHSFIYQRLALDVLSFVMVVAAKKQYLLPEELFERHRKMIGFLDSFMQKNGKLPNYGSNDGANLFPLSDDDYRDFRESLNFAAMANGGYRLFNGHGKIAELFGLTSSETRMLERKRAFEEGGYYILRKDGIFAFIRAHSYRHRPAQNDMFHLDIWYKGKNIFGDSGSYSYNTDQSFKNNFIGTVGHNTVMIENMNQMDQVLNFGYSNWTKAVCMEFDENHFMGENYAYVKKFGAVHQRKIDMEGNGLVVTDDILGAAPSNVIRQIWNSVYPVDPIDEHSFIVEGVKVRSSHPYRIEKAYISEYYNSYVLGVRIVFETQDKTITTTMEFL